MDISPIAALIEADMQLQGESLHRLGEKCGRGKDGLIFFQVAEGQLAQSGSVVWLERNVINKQPLRTYDTSNDVTSFGQANKKRIDEQYVNAGIGEHVLQIKGIELGIPQTKKLLALEKEVVAVMFHRLIFCPRMRAWEDAARQSRERGIGNGLTCGHVERGIGDLVL